MAKKFSRLPLYRSGKCPECGDTIEKGDEISILMVNTYTLNATSGRIGLTLT